MLLFHPQSFFCSKDLSWLFGQIGKNGLIWQARLVPKFMTSQLGLETVTIHVFPNQTMKVARVIKYQNRNIFLRKSCTKKARRLVPDVFVLQKALHEVKANALQLGFNLFL